MAANFVMFPGTQYIPAPIEELGKSGSLGLALGNMAQGILSGLGKRWQNKEMQQDIQQLMQYSNYQQQMQQALASQQMLQGLPQEQVQGITSTPYPAYQGLPQIQSPMVQQAMLGGLASKIFNQPTGLEQQKIVSEIAENLAQAKKLGQPEQPKGQRQIIYDEKSGDYKAIIADMATGETIRDLGRPTSKELIGQVAPEGLTTATKTKLETDIREVDERLAKSENVMSLWRPEFSTTGVQLETWWTKKRERAAGLPVVGGTIETIAPVTKEDKELLSKYSSWYGAAEQNYIAFRRWATGVAFNIQEKQEIRESFPEPKGKSPTEFKSMYDSMMSFDRRYKQKIVETIRQGTMVTPEIKSNIVMETLNEIRTLPPTEDVNSMSNEALLELYQRGK